LVDVPLIHPSNIANPIVRCRCAGMCLDHAVPAALALGIGETQAPIAGDATEARFGIPQRIRSCSPLHAATYTQTPNGGCLNLVGLAALRVAAQRFLNNHSHPAICS
jgi:hypothetical protein